MKRILSLALVLALSLCFAGCSNDKGRILYNVELEDYIELGEYKGIAVDTDSDEYEQIGTAYILNDIISNNLQSTKSVKKGTVKMGDIANIDFEGKKDGVAFEGGISKGYDLTIGSGNFISGFEEGLVGKKIGSTVDLNLIFPENYQNTDLAGQDVVFTVTINSVKTAKTPEEFYSSLGYASVEEYYENIEKRTVIEILQQSIIEGSEVKDYPQEDIDFLYEKYYKDFETTLANNYGMTVENYFTQVGMTEEQLKEEMVSQQIKPLMEMQMAWYAIFDKEGMELTDELKEETIKEMIASGGDSSVTRADIIETYGEYYIEMYAVSEMVFDFVEKNAKIS